MKFSITANNWVCKSFNHHSNFEYFIAENRLSDLNLKETQIQAKTIRLHFFMSISNQKSAYISQLKQIKIEIPSDVKIF